MKPFAQRGFTLLELLIVMAVIGAVLATASLAMGPILTAKAARPWLNWAHN